MLNPPCAISDGVPIRIPILSSGRNALFKFEFATLLNGNGLRPTVYE